MPLNKAKGNMYPWVTHTWNPVKGKCPYDCSYCYVSRMFKRFKKEQKTLGINTIEACTDLGKYRTIFVCSGCDLFHPDVLYDWIHYIGQQAFDFSLNRYILHTKNPERARKFYVDFPIDTVLYSARHYKDGRVVKLFCGPGEKMVLLTDEADALFVRRKFIDDSGQQGVNCAVFRNEGRVLSSLLIKGGG